MGNICDQCRSLCRKGEEGRCVPHLLSMADVLSTVYIVVTFHCNPAEETAQKWFLQKRMCHPIRLIVIVI